MGECDWSPYDVIFTHAPPATVQAFGINNHRVNGNRLEDPYVDDVRRGLPYLEAALSAAGIPTQPAGNPDTNGNGIGLSYNQSIYISGQVADAFVGAGLQTTLATAGDATYVRGRTYRDLVQDIMDGYWYGQSDVGGSGRGGWHYGWNYGSADNSTAQWGAITGLAGENAWNIPVPQWVKDENLNYWLRYSQSMNPGFYNGSFGYSQSEYCPWSSCMSTTPSGLVQMNFDGVRNDPNATTDNEIRQDNIKSRRSTGMSLMPNGFESLGKEIGKALTISPRTVEIYRARLMRKYKASNTGDLVHKLITG